MLKENREDRQITVLFNNSAANVYHVDFYWVDSSWTDEEIWQFLAQDEYDILMDYSFDDEPDSDEDWEDHIGLGLTEITWHDTTDEEREEYK